ncbi:DUF4190 domain-containing protein [Streptomyces melanogenes]|uniref:DUF4190 domain-containing protein n=1 Tax=Streptomyces melanogenes TaxID=67326 RepID=UPI0037AAC25D
MSDNRDQPSQGAGPGDPWAPPERKVPLEKPGQRGEPGRPEQPEHPEHPEQAGRPVHDQPTVTSMPVAGESGPSDAAGPGAGPGTGPGPGGGAGWGGAVPPPPTAPGGPGQAVPGSYGYPAYPGYPGYPGYGHPGWTGMGAPLNGFGTTALVLGIVSVVLFCLWGLGVILGILALVFGFLGRGRAKRGQATNGGQALAGIILGAVGVVVSAVFLGLMIWAVTNDEDGSDSSDYDDPFATSLVIRDVPPTPPLP